MSRLLFGLGVACFLVAYFNEIAGNKKTVIFLVLVGIYNILWGLMVGTPR